MPPSGRVFGGGGSIQLARVFGIRIGVDVSWFFVLFLIIWSLSGYYGDLFPGEDAKAFVLAVAQRRCCSSCSILLHELGHAVVAMRNGIPIVGHRPLAVRRRGEAASATPTRPASSSASPSAGPLVTLAIARALLRDRLGDRRAPSSVLDGARFEDGRRRRGDRRARLPRLDQRAACCVFNLIPGFPLDGGRIARAIAWKITGDRNRATRFAAALGRGVALG